MWKKWKGGGENTNEIEHNAGSLPIAKRGKWAIISLMKIKPLDPSCVFYSFILLKFIATCLITNTHYDNVYPIGALAVGGLLGDILFFIVSGFVLSKPTKENIFVWYGKRIIRIYPAVLIMILINLCTGSFLLQGKTFFDIIKMFIFPTAYVFVGAIMLLYIVLYFFNKIEDKKKSIALIVIVFMAYLIVYSIFFDKSIYQMNNTNHPMILFPYGIAMLVGSYMRKFVSFSKDSKLRMVMQFVVTFILAMIYFATNNFVRSKESLLPFQILVPITLLLTSIFLVISFYYIEKYIRRVPKTGMNVINFIATLTLEIYVVQRPIINAFDQILFPINWIIITALIIIAALLLRIVVNIMIHGVSILLKRIFNKKQTEL